MGEIIEGLTEFIRTALASLLSLGGDVLIPGAFFAGFAWYGLRYGKHRLISIILSLYAGALIYTALPAEISAPFFSGTLPTRFESPFMQAGVFLAIVAFIHAVTDRFISAEFPYDRIRGWFEAALLSAAAAALVLSFSYHIVSFAGVFDFSRSVSAFFSSPVSLFWWLAFSLGALLFSVRRL